MSRRQKGLFVFIFVLIIGIAVYLVERMMVPDEFLSEEEILSGLPLQNPDKEIQDIIQIDEETYFVPYVSGENMYGTSIWKWLGGKWENVSESESSGPSILQGDSEQYVYWNIHPEDDVRKLTLYLIGDRNYSLSYQGSEDESSFYLPHLQVSNTVETGNESYGYALLPSDLMKISETLRTNPKTSQGIANSNMFQYRWQALNSEGESTGMEETYRGGGSGTHTGNYVLFMTELSEEELE